MTKFRLFWRTWLTAMANFSYLVLELTAVTTYLAWASFEADRPTEQIYTAATFEGKIKNHLLQCVGLDVAVIMLKLLMSRMWMPFHALPLYCACLSLPICVWPFCQLDLNLLSSRFHSHIHRPNVYLPFNFRWGISLSITTKRYTLAWHPYLTFWMNCYKWRNCI